jgi:hypothetical protein
LPESIESVNVTSGRVMCDSLNNAILEICFYAGLLKAFCSADQLEGSIDISASPDLEDKRRIIEVARGCGC